MAERLTPAAAGASHPTLRYIGTSGGVTLESSESFPQVGAAYDADPPPPIGRHPTSICRSSCSRSARAPRDGRGPIATVTWESRRRAGAANIFLGYRFALLLITLAST